MESDVHFFKYNFDILTSDVNGFQGKGLLLVVHKSGLFCLVSHCWQRFGWARVWAVWTGYKKKNTFKHQYFANSTKTD